MAAVVQSIDREVEGDPQHTLECNLSRCHRLFMPSAIIIGMYIQFGSGFKHCIVLHCIVLYSLLQSNWLTKASEEGDLMRDLYISSQQWS